MLLSKRLHVASAVGALLLLSSLAAAQWEKKPHTEWSNRDAVRVLNDSPWAKTQVFSDPTAMFNVNPDVRAQREGSAVSDVVHINFRIRFLSARPVREAFSRLIETQQKGGSEGLEEQLNQFVNSESPDHIVVAVNVDARGPGGNFQEALGLLLNASTAVLKHNTYLEVKGKRAYLEEYIVPGKDVLGARFVFPRFVDGSPLVTTETSDIKFYSELSQPSGLPDSKAPRYTLNMRFRIPPMKYRGKLEI